MDSMGRLCVRLRVKRDKLGNGGLSHAEHVIADVMGVETEVMNGGLHQFFFNPAGDRAVETIAALREIGATAPAAIVAEACARCPDGAPAPDRPARQRQLEALAFGAFRDLDKRFGRCRDKIVTRVAAYWQKHGGSAA